MTTIHHLSSFPSIPTTLTCTPCPRHLSRAMLVCTEWAEAAGEARLWRTFPLVVGVATEAALTTRLTRTLALPRLQYLQHLEVGGTRGCRGVGVH